MSLWYLTRIVVGRSQRDLHQYEKKYKEDETHQACSTEYT